MKNGTSGPWRPDDIGRTPGSGSGGSWRAPLLGAKGPLALETPAVRERLARRLRVLEIGAVLLVGLLLLGFWNLQVIHATHYREQAEDNRLRKQRLRPTRGLIIDRDGEVLASNRAAYNVAVVREETPDPESTLAWLGRVLDRPAEQLRSRLGRHAATVPDFRPVVVAEDVDLEVVAAVQSHRREHPGVRVLVEAKRHYPNGTLGAHYLGHVGEISATQLTGEAGSGRRMGDIVGQSGLEKVYDAALFGEVGGRTLLVNSSGRTVRVLEESPPRPGDTLKLTVDLALQRRAEEELRDKRGAAVVLDVATGGVLAMASSPSFDPNAFAARFSEEQWERLSGDPDKPLQNRALLGAYPPGSVFKLVMAAGGLKNGHVTPSTTVFCAGGGTFYGRFFRCLGQHGSVSMRQALAKSCNTYFYELGRRLGRDRIVAAARMFGLGSPTGIDLPREGRGILPSDGWLARHERRWYPGETISVSIGQGVLGASALQLARIGAGLARGQLPTPHLMAGVEDPESGETHRVWEEESHPVPLSDRDRQAILDGMRRSVSGGTSWRAAVHGHDIGGKTGSAQVASSDNLGPEEERPEELRDHAWFVGLAPIDDPRVTVAVFVQHGGSGSSVAAPMGGRILDAWFDGGRTRVADRRDRRAQEPNRRRGSSGVEASPGTRADTGTEEASDAP